MSRYSKIVATMIHLILVTLLGIHAQSQETLSGSQRNTVVFLDSTKEQEGLSGAVRRMRVESARLELKAGKLTEGPRQLMEVTTYDVKGKRVENVSYPFSTATAGKEEYKYDERGNVIEMTLRGDDGSILSKERYEYEYDKVGNWTKMMTSLVVFEGGELKLEPVEATYRSFSYYFSDTVEKMVNAKSTPSQLAESPKSVASIAPANDKDLGRSNLENTSPMVLVPAAGGTIESNFSAKTPEVSSPEAPPASGGAAATPINKSAAEFSEPSHTAVNTQPTEEPVLNTTSTRLLDSEPVDVQVSKAAALEKPMDLKTSSPPQAGQGDARFPGKSSKFVDRSPVEPTHASSESIGVANSSTIEPTTSVSNEASPSPVNVVKIREEQPTRLLAAAASKAIEPSTSGAAVTPADSQNALALYALGRDLFDSGDFKGAVEAYKQSIKLEPESAEYHLSLAQAYIQLKKNGDAINALKQAIHLNPAALEAHYGLGLVYFTVRRYSDALVAFKQAIKLDPKMSKAHFGLAMTHSELRNNNEVLREYRILQKLDPVLARKVSETFPDFSLLPCRVPPFCNK